MAKLINKAFKTWTEKILNPLLSSRPARKSNFESSSGINFPKLSFPSCENNQESSYLDKQGFPGEFPFTRGVYASMYRARLWTMRQYAGFGTATETNKRYKTLLKGGTTGLSVAFDLPTQMGFDSDHKRAKGEVGRVGVAIDSVEDMERLFDGIPLGEVSTSMTINSTAHILLAMYIGVAKQQGVEVSKIRGTIQNDILKEYIARGTYIYPPKESLRITADIFEYCKDELPAWNTISVSGYHIREAGSTAVQEVAFTLANGLAYLRAATERGLDIDDVAPRMAFFFNCHNNFLEEIAKFRVARRIWARLVKEEFDPKNEKSLKLRFHTQTAGSTLTAQQPLVNIVRTGTQALAAVLGGTQSLHTNAWDEALGLPCEEAALCALRTQQYLAYESGVADVVDPLAGSYFLEDLSDQIEVRVLEYFQKVESLGGMVAAIEEEFPQKEIETAAFDYQKKVEAGEAKVVGVNIAVNEEVKSDNQFGAVQKPDPRLEVLQRERLQSLKDSRDSKKVKDALLSLEQAAKEGTNIMPSVLVSVEKKATLGEISDVLRGVFGLY